jgi:hypothetical protein
VQHRGIARPFHSHEIADGLLNEGVLKVALAEFPTPAGVNWYKYDNAFERKLATNQLHQIHPVLRDVLCALNSTEFIGFLEVLTGICDLITDADYIAVVSTRSNEGGTSMFTRTSTTTRQLTCIDGSMSCYF